MASFDMLEPMPTTLVAFTSPSNGRTGRAPLLAIPAILTCNLTHIVPLFHPFYAVVPAILHANMGHIVLLAPTFKFTQALYRFSQVK